MKLNKILLPTFAILCGLFTMINSASAQIATFFWQKAGAPNENWRAVASSADGTKLVAAASYGLVQISTNSGSTWTPTSLSTSLVLPGRTAAASADGTILAVAAYAKIYVSIDSGATWTARVGSQNWAGIACSTNGTKMVAVGEGSPIYTSTDSGTNWTARDASRNWADVASSADGTKLVAAEGGVWGVAGQIYTSTDSGATWTARATAQQWSGVASSADGTKLVAVDWFDSNFSGGAGYLEGAGLGVIYTSNDSGTNWTRSTAPLLGWTSVASSADGSHLVAVSQDTIGQHLPCLIYTSTDSGASWQLSYASDIGWQCVASSADGAKLAAAGLGNAGIYTYATPPTNAPTLGIAISGGNKLLSWPWPSAGFALQQNSDPATTNWVTVPNTPAVVNQVIVAPASPNTFYRLVSP
ncbi:MAG: hypothetical protein JWR26_3872 [Pedosphaera sp.]|nr:hypothetical protein [Pedosphaera sp.]